jgi:tRNA (guanine37-N1)-methyltransferase
MKPKIKIRTVSIFPEMFKILIENGVISKSIKNGLINFEAINLRDYTVDKHKVTDKPGYGGGAGMVMLAEPFFKAYEHFEKEVNEKPYVILTSPMGKTLNNEMSKKLALKKNLMFFCGRYEGIDNRVKSIIDEEISIGDYILTGGEIPALVIIDSLLRFVPGVVGDQESVVNDSFYEGLLDYSHYTKPEELRGYKIPEVLKSGNHKNIAYFRKKDSLLNTIMKRPDLFIKKELTEEQKKMVVEIIEELSKDAE